MKVFAFINQKGGVGKTTSVVTLGSGLALRGYKTLIVDCDPQGHVATQLGIPKSPGLRRWYYDEEPLDQVIVQVRNNLMVITSDKTTDRVLGRMREEQWGAAEFADRLREESAAMEFDAVLLDLAPSLNHLQIAAMLASDYVIIPTRLRYTDLDGVNEITRSISETARRSRMPGRYFLLPTFFDRVTRETHQRLLELVNAFGKQVLPPIPQDVKIAEAPGRGMTVWEYAPQCSAVKGYLNGSGKTVGGYEVILDELIRLIESA
ncbi:MAG: ParA family protein [Candidatus Hadarchaeum sp.]|uniref:ParA family protein n=1 Tax=Candidatus Hadarchaeum sp. TaxID=2883567 RepID=UPI00316B989E